MRARNETVRAGFTILELMMAAGLFAILVGALGTAVMQLVRSRDASSVVTDLQDVGTLALQQIRRDLRQSAFATVNGAAFPYLFDDGNALAPFAPHFHAVVPKQAQANEYDFGPNRELIFVLPADNNADDIPDVALDGTLIWDINEYSYVVITDAEGINVLQRRTNTGSPRPIARYVERVAFDSAATAVGEVPLNVIRVRIWFRRPDPAGLTFKYFVEAMVRLRNS